MITEITLHYRDRHEGWNWLLSFLCFRHLLTDLSTSIVTISLLMTTGSPGSPALVPSGIESKSKKAFKAKRLASNSELIKKVDNSFSYKSWKNSLEDDFSLIKIDPMIKAVHPNAIVQECEVDWKDSEYCPRNMIAIILLLDYTNCTTEPPRR